MLLRKMNAACSLLCTVLLLDHAIYIAVCTLSKGSVAVGSNLIPWMLVGAMALHAFISIELAVSAHAGVEKRKCKSYPQLNAPTLFQRVSGILLIVFTALHVAGTMGVMQPPRMVHAILPPLFFTLSLAHAAVSTSKAFISLGIGNAKFVKVADVVIKVICAVTLIADIIGFYLFLV